MPGRSVKKRKTTAKAPPIIGRPAAAHRTVPKKAFEKSENSPSVAGRRKPRGVKIGPAGARKLTSRQQRETGQTRAEARPQKRHRIERVEPTQEPRIKASSLTPAKRTLSTEARELLAKVDEGGIPLMMTRNLERIASEHGITVGGDMTADDAVRLLRDLARAGGMNQGIEKAKKQPDIFANIIWPDTPGSNRDE